MTFIKKHVRKQPEISRSTTFYSSEDTKKLFIEQKMNSFKNHLTILLNTSDLKEFTQTYQKAQEDLTTIIPFEQDYSFSTPLPSELLKLLSEKKDSLINGVQSRAKYASSPVAASSAKNFDQMSGVQFEQFCIDLLIANGFLNVTATKASGDQGIDILAEKDSIHYGIQCKCYHSNVGNAAVQEAYSGSKFYNCHVAVVLTNRYFTPAAVELAKKTGVILWDRQKLMQLISNAADK